LTVQKEGVYKAEASVATACTVTGEIKIEYAPQIMLSNTSIIKCDNRSFFDLTKVEAGIRNGTPATTFDYYETQTGPILSDPIKP
jgi:hypothetical protein